MKTLPPRKKVNPIIDRSADAIGYDPMDPRDYHAAIQIFRAFFLDKKGFLNAFVQHRFNILSACEDPDTIAQFAYSGQTFPLRQTNQMELEYELLARLGPKCPGLICETHSSRQEPNPEPGRHDKSFAMGEFEFPSGTDIHDLLNTEMAFLEHAGFGPQSSYRVFRYEELARHYGVSALTSAHERMMWEEFGPVVFITHFPESTSPFFNMGRLDGVALKIDVILFGIETIGSAVRSSIPEGPEGMWHSFHTISGGNYARRLFALFTKERVLQELREFISLPFFPRSGGGIGMTRFIRALKLAGIITMPPAR